MSELHDENYEEEEVQDSIASHHRALLLVLVLGGGLSRSITWRDATWMDSKMREDLEQQFVQNHRHRRLIDQRSNHRHRRHRLLHP